MAAAEAAVPRGGAVQVVSNARHNKQGSLQTHGFTGESLKDGRGDHRSTTQLRLPQARFLLSGFPIPPCMLWLAAAFTAIWG
jgi:hypothetical protein